MMPAYISLTGQSPRFSGRPHSGHLSAVDPTGTRQSGHVLDAMARTVDRSPSYHMPSLELPSMSALMLYVPNKSDHGRQPFSTPLLCDPSAEVGDLWRALLI
jgi:hypothetical protein